MKSSEYGEQHEAVRRTSAATIPHTPTLSSGHRGSARGATLLGTLQLLVFGGAISVWAYRFFEDRHAQSQSTSANALSTQPNIFIINNGVAEPNAANPRGALVPPSDSRSSPALTSPTWPATLQEILADRTSAKWTTSGDELGRANGDCTGVLGGVPGDFEVILKTRYAPAATYGLSVAVTTQVTGRADGTPYRETRETVAECQRLFDEIHATPKNVTFSRIPETCNQALALTRAIRCSERLGRSIRQAVSEVEASAKQLVDLRLAQSVAFAESKTVGGSERGTTLSAEAHMELPIAPRLEVRAEADLPRLEPHIFRYVDKNGVPTLTTEGIHDQED